MRPYGRGIWRPTASERPDKEKSRGVIGGSGPAGQPTSRPYAGGTWSEGVPPLAPTLETPSLPM
jgi:hypothetical protein